jgi:hypothetical protein
MFHLLGSYSEALVYVCQLGLGGTEKHLSPLLAKTNFAVGKERE